MAARSKRPITGFASLLGLYSSGGTTSRTSDAIEVDRFADLILLVKVSSPSGSPKFDFILECSNDGSQWYSSPIQQWGIGTILSNRIIWSNIQKQVRVTITLSSGTSVTIDRVEADAQV